MQGFVGLSLLSFDEDMLDELYFTQFMSQMAVEMPQGYCWKQPLLLLKT